MNELRYKCAFTLFRLGTLIVGLSHRVNPYLRNSDYANTPKMIQHYRKWSKGQEINNTQDAKELVQ